MAKLFHKPSNEHAGMEAGTRVKLLKDHREIGGSIDAGSECIVDEIIHFPTRFRLKDVAGNLWTVPIHSVELIAEETEEKIVEKEGEADQGG